MKIFKYVAMTIAVMATMTSCLKSNLAELPSWTESKLTDVRFDYRYYGTNIWDDEPVVEYLELKLDNKVVNDEASTITCAVQVPKASGMFTEAEKAKVSLTNLTCIVWGSTAIRITPEEGSPKLGVPGDWSKPNKYRVMAADGSSRIWTITVTSLVQL